MFSKILDTLFGSFGKPDDENDAESTSMADAYYSLDESDSTSTSYDTNARTTLSFLRTVLASEPVENSHVDGSVLLARTRIRRLPGGLTVTGHVDLRQCQRFRGFGDGCLKVGGSLLIGGTAPQAVMVGMRADIAKGFGNRVCQFVATPSREKRCPLVELPETTTVGGSLVLRDCPELTRLPQNLSVGESIVVQSCRKLSDFDVPASVNGNLVLRSCCIRRLPDNLSVAADLVLEGLPIEALPAGLKVGGSLLINQCPRLAVVPNDLVVGKDLSISFTAVREIPAGIQVGGAFSIRRSPVEMISAEISVGSNFKVRQCEELTAISADEWLVRGDLLLNVCPKLVQLPSSITVNGIMSLTHARSLTKPPQSLRIDAFAQSGGNRFLKRRYGVTLSLTDCANLKSLPLELALPVDGSVDIAGTPIESITPKQMKRLRFRWRGVAISARALFDPESLTADEVLGEWNAEVRRVMMERLGPQRLMEKGDAHIVDADKDAGGLRELVEFTVARGGPVPRRFLHCFCPSTGREYLLGVPHDVGTCHAAAAWLAGFENPDDYQPETET